MPTLADLYLAMPVNAEYRRQKDAIKKSTPVVRLWVNPPNGETADGCVYLGRVDLRDCEQYEFPFKNNEGAAGNFTLRAEHYLAKKIAQIPNTPEMCKNIVITVDMYTGLLRWSGLMHHWMAASPERTDFLSVSFNDDLQFLDFMLVPPNPALPIPIFQFPRVFILFGPTRWCVSVLILMQIIRLEGHLWTLPDDPFDFSQWFELLTPAQWQVHIKCPDLLSDDSLWTLLAGRMNTVTSVVADALDDAQNTITYRRIMTCDGEKTSGLLGILGEDNVKNGALVFEIVDRSGFTLPAGTFFGGTIVAGFERSVLTWASGFVEDTLTMMTSTDQLYPDEYYQTSWMQTLAAAPGIVIRDSMYTQLESEVAHSPPTAVSVIVGSDNPTADAIAKLIIEAVGNLIGYFLLAGFDSLGDIAADIIMPFLIGTILAWDEWKNFGRADQLGWVHLHEIYQTGADNNAWSLTALAVIRGGFNSTGTKTSHKMIIREDSWPIPGLHFQIGDRIGSTSAALSRLGVHLIFVNRIEEMTLQGKGVDKQFLCKAGKNQAQMTQGERWARLLKKVFSQIENIGVHLIA